MNRKTNILGLLALLILILLVGLLLRKNYLQKRSDAKAEKAHAEELAAIEAKASESATPVPSQLVSESSKPLSDLIPPVGIKDYEDVPSFDAHFEFARKKNDIVIVNYEGSDKDHPNTYTHAICDGELIPLERSSFDASQWTSRLGALNVYKLARDTKSKGICILMRDFDPKTYLRVSFDEDASKTFQKCSPTQEKSLWQIDEKAKVEYRYCQSRINSENSSSLKAITRVGHECEARLFHNGKTSGYEVGRYTGRFGVDKDGKEDPSVTQCIFDGPEGPMEEMAFLAARAKEVPLAFEIDGNLYNLITSKGKDLDSYTLNDVSFTAEHIQVSFLDDHSEPEFWLEEKSVP